MRFHIHSLKNFKLTAAIFLIAFFLVSCENDPIFAAIEQEVKLKDPSVQGTVSDLVIVGQNIYTTNGNIYCRLNGTGDWKKIDSPSFRCSQIATDGTYLYGLFQNSDYQFDSICRYDGTSWINIDNITNVEKIGSGNGYIYAFNEADSLWNAYTITGTTSAAIAGGTGLALPVGSEGNYFATIDTVYTSDGTNLSYAGDEIKALTTVDSYLFVVDSGSIYRYYESAWTTWEHDISKPTGITYLSDKNILLISGAKGFGEVTLNELFEMTDNISAGSSSLSSIATSAKNQYKNSVGKWNVSSITAVSSPVPDGDDYVIYASIVDPTYDGLWAYYSNTQKEWNRE